ncbi:hypothetical protein SLA2020_263720 [Shorea laevis]
MELVDPKLGFEFNKEAIRMIKIALLCTNPSPALRPTMSAVVSMLEGRTIVHELLMDPSIYGEEMRFKALRHPLVNEAETLTESVSNNKGLLARKFGQLARKFPLVKKAKRLVKKAKSSSQRYQE